MSKSEKKRREDFLRLGSPQNLLSRLPDNGSFGNLPHFADANQQSDFAFLAMDGLLDLPNIIADEENNELGIFDLDNEEISKEELFKFENLCKKITSIRADIPEKLGTLPLYELEYRENLKITCTDLLSQDKRYNLTLKTLT